MARFTLDRRAALAGLAATGAAGLLPSCAATPPPADDGFVRREGTGFVRHGRPYRFAGANAWYLAWLGSTGRFGDRARLARELDRLKALGVTNLRVLAGAEEGPLKASIKPGFVNAHGLLDNDLLEGLDVAMAEIARRDMVAVLYVSNFWEWSGGMMTRLFYATGEYVDMNDPAHPWPAFPDATAAFYGNAEATQGYYDYICTLVTRTNGVTGRPYAEDPAIMAWQLGNEPRPGGTEAGIARHLPAYYAWIDRSAALIRSLDRNHLVSLGMEGTIACNGREDVVVRAHRNIDYLTAHIWPLNWGWVNGKDLAGTWDAGKLKVADYLAAHIRIAGEAGKPLVFEEFGFPRDGELYDPAVATTFRERYYRLIYDTAERSLAEGGGPVAGTNFWAWNGEGRAQHADHRFRPGADSRYLGDPPHEPQGWYGVFDSDAAVIALIRDHAARFATAGVSAQRAARSLSRLV